MAEWPGSQLSWKKATAWRLHPGGGAEGLDVPSAGAGHSHLLPLPSGHSLDCTAPDTPSCALQGKVHLELRLSEVITDTGVVCHKLATR
ncbi:Ras GTPase-activating protein 3 [Plecturocebus cupreus]